MSHLSRTVAALAEINPPVAAAVRAVGPNRSGNALPGLLIWLPTSDLADLARACWLATGPEAAQWYGYENAEEFAEDLAIWPGPLWRPSTEERVTEAVIAWSQASDREPVLDLLTVAAGDWITD